MQPVSAINGFGLSRAVSRILPMTRSSPFWRTEQELKITRSADGVVCARVCVAFLKPSLFKYEEILSVSE